MKPSGLTLAFLVVFMMAIMYNSVEAAAKPDAEAVAEALANAIATGDPEALAGWKGTAVLKAAPGMIKEVSS